MRIIESKKVVIGSDTFTVRNDIYAMVCYQDLLTDTDNEIVKSIKWYYCLSKAGATDKGIEFTYSYDEFFKIVNKYGLDAIQEFNRVLKEPMDSKKK